MYIPSATYRVQLNSSFRLEHLRKIIPYLAELGISTIYASPFFIARKGSTHGYDVTNPWHINPELGTDEEFSFLKNELNQYSMGWIQDIVPNHMAYDTDNSLLMDIFEKGPESEYAGFFDIDWEHPDFNGKIMLPFLGAPLKKVIQNKELKIILKEEGFFLKYYDNYYPLALRSYPLILELAGVKEKIPAESSVKESEWNPVKTKIFQEYKKGISTVLEKLTNADLDKILSLQYFLPAYWRESESKINYRRFFTVNDLICLNIHDHKVFEAYHRFIEYLCRNQLINGVRVDHIDGLFDPGAYLQNLRDLLPDETFIIVEKILEAEEFVPYSWNIQGNTGYDFLGLVNHLFTNPAAGPELDRIYKKFIGAKTDYHEMVFSKKQYMLENFMAGELNNLMSLLHDLELKELYDGQLPDEEIKKALAILMCSFPVYRIYGNELPLPDEEVELLEKVFAGAERRAPELKNAFDLFRHIFLEHDRKKEVNHNKIAFILRTQQFTGPLAAKGIEDTTFYNYNRLVSHNEVGDCPDTVGISIADFHQKMQDRKRYLPFSINASATHDTKRGEDARLRINVISELHSEWETLLTDLSSLSKKTKGLITANDEYFLYQTIAGIYPVNVNADQGCIQRVQEYMIKALREGKTSSNWSEPNEAYEQDMKNFIELIFNDSDFLHAMMPFIKKASRFGSIYSIAQTILKLTAPGIPDVYQGTELNDLSMVDPDNRRPVNFEERNDLLHYFKKIKKENLQDELSQLYNERENGRLKMFILHKLLIQRKRHQSLFNNGKYLPLKVSGKCKKHLLAFARKQEKNWGITVIPVQLALHSHENHLGDAWADTFVELPIDYPKNLMDIITCETYAVKAKIPVAQIFKTLPFAYLSNLKK